MSSLMNEYIRVSGVGLCRICNPNHQYLLGANPNRQNVLTPIGGAFWFDKDAPLLQWEPIFLDNQQNELRFLLRRTILNDFATWFRTRKQRETNPFREFYEELVDEYAVIPKLEPSDVLFRHYRTVEYEGITKRLSQAGWPTHYILELFDVEFINQMTWERLRDIGQHLSLEWVTRAEIETGISQTSHRVIDAEILLSDS